MQLVHKVLNCKVFHYTKWACVGSKTSKYCWSIRQGSKNFAICKIVNIMLHTNLLRGWRVAHHSTTSRVLASGQILDSNNDMKLLSWNTKYLGAASSWKNLEIQTLFNVHCGKWLMFLWHFNSICDSRVRGGKCVGQGLGISMHSWRKDHHCHYLLWSKLAPLKSTQSLQHGVWQVALINCIPMAFSVLYS